MHFGRSRSAGAGGVLWRDNCQLPQSFFASRPQYGAGPYLGNSFYRGPGELRDAMYSGTRQAAEEYARSEAGRYEPVQRKIAEYFTNIGLGRRVQKLVQDGIRKNHWYLPRIFFSV